MGLSTTFLAVPINIIRLWACPIKENFKWSAEQAKFLHEALRSHFEDGTSFVIIANKVRILPAQIFRDESQDKTNNLYRVLKPNEQATGSKTFAHSFIVLDMRMTTSNISLTWRCCSQRIQYRLLLDIDLCSELDHEQGNSSRASFWGSLELKTCHTPIFSSNVLP